MGDRIGNSGGKHWIFRKPRATGSPGARGIHNGRSEGAGILRYGAREKENQYRPPARVPTWGSL